ncbi:MAG: AraC family transcriptional regulator [Ramlibacter sp.]|nr:AraC family transcriptional regulator [Ramlibacter sp.]
MLAELQPAPHSPCTRAACPPRLARAPRLATASGRPSAQLMPVPAVLQGAVVAVIARDARHLPLDDAQRLSHYPASPLMSLSWYQGAEVGWAVDGTPWAPFGSRVTVGGSQSQPTVTWADRCGQGIMVCFLPDTAHALLGVDPAAVTDRVVPAATVLAPHALPLLDALAHAADATAALAAVAQHLGPHWQALNARSGPAPTLRQIGRHWVERLALQAQQWRGERSPRQVERRVKAWSGRSLREWQALVRAEGAFFAARDRHDAGLPYEWAAIAQDEGFADQAHLVRATRRITGFSPGEFTARFATDESFWLYRCWV